LAQVKDMGIEVQDLTVVLGKGTDSPALVDLVDSQEDLHLIAAYAPDFLPELAEVPLKDFSTLPCKYNRRVVAEGTPEDQILYYETQANVWHRPHKVAVTYDPRIFAVQEQEFQEKIQRVRQEFATVQRKWEQGELPDEDPQSLEAHLLQVCQYLQLPPELFRLNFGSTGSPPAMSLELQEEVMERVMRGLGKTILITDHDDWSGVEISEANIDRCVVEEQIRQTGITLQEVLLPQYHWTESKLRVNIFVCMVALSYLILLCQRLIKAGLLMNPKEVMEDLRALRTAVFWRPEEEKLKRRLVPPTDTQLAILHALGFKVEDGRVFPSQ